MATKKSYELSFAEIKKKLENILIIGSGGRENSLGWAIQKNELIKNTTSFLNNQKFNNVFLWG